MGEKKPWPIPRLLYWQAQRLILDLDQLADTRLESYFLSYSSTSLQQENGESPHCPQSYVTSFIIRAALKKN